MRDKNSQQALYAAILAVIVLLWALVYAVPRWKAIGALERESQGYAKERQNIANSLAALQRSRSDLEAPQPNAVAWIAAHALEGLDRNVECNNPYKNGQGAQLKLRKITASDIDNLLRQLSTVSFVITSFKLEDSDGDGFWNLELMVEVPS